MENRRNVEADVPAAQSCCAPGAKSGWLNSRNLLIGAAVLGGGSALFFGWNWLVAAGLASVIVGVLPCLVMCALGICASRMGKKDTSSPTAAVPPKEVDPQAQVTSAHAEASVLDIPKPNDAAPQPAKRAA